MKSEVLWQLCRKTTIGNLPLVYYLLYKVDGKYRLLIYYTYPEIHHSQRTIKEILSVLRDEFSDNELIQPIVGILNILTKYPGTNTAPRVSELALVLQNEFVKLISNKSLLTIDKAIEKLQNEDSNCFGCP